MNPISSITNITTTNTNINNTNATVTVTYHQPGRTITFPTNQQTIFNMLINFESLTTNGLTARVYTFTQEQKLYFEHFINGSVVIDWTISFPSSLTLRAFISIFYDYVMSAHNGIYISKNAVTCIITEGWGSLWF